MARKASSRGKNRDKDPSALYSKAKKHIKSTHHAKNKASAPELLSQVPSAPAHASKIPSAPSAPSKPMAGISANYDNTGKKLSNNSPKQPSAPRRPPAQPMNDLSGQLPPPPYTPFPANNSFEEPPCSNIPNNLPPRSPNPSQNNTVPLQHPSNIAFNAQEPFPNVQQQQSSHHQTTYNAVGSGTIPGIGPFHYAPSEFSSRSRPSLGLPDNVHVNINITENRSSRGRHKTTPPFNQNPSFDPIPPFTQPIPPIQSFETSFHSQSPHRQSETRRPNSSSTQRTTNQAQRSSYSTAPNPQRNAVYTELIVFSVLFGLFLIILICISLYRRLYLKKQLNSSPSKPLNIAANVEDEAHIVIKKIAFNSQAIQMFPNIASFGSTQFALDRDVNAFSRKPTKPRTFKRNFKKSKFFKNNNLINLGDPSPPAYGEIFPQTPPNIPSVNSASARTKS